MKTLTTKKGFVTPMRIGDICLVWKNINNPDPEVNNEREIHFIEERVKIPASLWAALIDFYFYFAKEHNSEVRVELYKHLTDNTWKILVPKQKVNFASCFDQKLTDQVDLITGQKYNPKEDLQEWSPYGSSHSHGKLTLADFSATDDAEELNKTGAHILVSNIDLKNKTYIVTPSLVWNGERSIIDFSDIIEDDEEATGTYHPDAVKQVTYFVPKIRAQVTRAKKTVRPPNTLQGGIEAYCTEKFLTDELVKKVIAFLKKDPYYIALQHKSGCSGNAANILVRKLEEEIYEGFDLNWIETIGETYDL